MFIDMDASKRAVSAMAYHLRGDRLPPEGQLPPRTDIEPILFLGRLMTPAETRYWPTEMEVAALVWVVKKIRHLIDGADKPVVVFTNHASTVDIVNHTHLGTSTFGCPRPQWQRGQGQLPNQTPRHDHLVWNE